MTELALLQSTEFCALRDRNSELAGELRAAVLADDELHIKRLLSELLRCQGLTRGQRMALQMRALLRVVQALRCLVLTDDATGLCNQRGFMHAGTRVLDVATRDRQEAHLLCFELHDAGPLASLEAGHVLIRQMGNVLRDLFPSYGVYEVLGRLGASRFAALTTRAEYATRSSVLLSARRPQVRSRGLPPLVFRVGVAHFNPARPAAIDELLAEATRVMRADKPRTTLVAPASAARTSQAS